MSNHSKKIKNPCRGGRGELSCTTNFGGDYCKACGRTVEEIRDWNSYTETQKLNVIKRIESGSKT